MCSQLILRSVSLANSEASSLHTWLTVLGRNHNSIYFSGLQLQLSYTPASDPQASGAASPDA
jgi:hypothetical protein